jgi:hypothetical protein
MADERCQLCCGTLDVRVMASAREPATGLRVHAECPVCREWDEPGPRSVSAFERHEEIVDVATFHQRCWHLYDMARLILREELPGHSWRLVPPSRSGTGEVLKPGTQSVVRTQWT